MLDPSAAPHVAIVAAIVVALGVAMPILVVRRTARPDDLRERILLSRPGRVEAHGVGSIVVHAIGAAAFGVLAAVAHPILWGVAALSVSSIVATSVYLHRFRRALRAFETEIAGSTDADGEPGSSVSA